MHSLPIRQAKEKATADGHGEQSKDHRSLVGLPAEILHYMLDEHLGLKEYRLRPEDWHKPGCQQARHNDTLQTIQQLRQVCRLLHDIVSPLLCQKLRIRLNEDSLAGACALVSNASIASGVRCVQVALPLFPQEIASALHVFCRLRVLALRKLKDSFAWLQEAEMFAGGDTDPYAAEQDALWAIHAGWEPHERTPSEIEEEARREEEYAQWREENPEWVEEDEDEEDEDEEDEEAVAKRKEYGDMLVKGYRIFKEQSEAQQDLIESGRFVKRTARLLCELPDVVALSIIDRLDSQDSDYQLSVTDMEMLSSFLASPFNWSQLEDMKARPALAPARLLAELPIAIHRQGGTLRHLHVGCMPIEDHFDQLVPPTDGFSWSSLRAACQELQVFKLGGDQLSCGPIRRETLPLDVRQLFVGYLGAALSSRKLQEVALDLRFLGLNDGRGKKEECPLGAVFESIDWPGIRRASLSSIGLTQRELDQLCAGLGPRLERLFLTSLHLRDGSWAGALDVLRARVASGHARGDVWVYLSSFTGGEFGTPMSRDRPEFDSEEEDDEMPEGPLIDHATRYVTDEGETCNPLRRRSRRDPAVGGK